VTTSEGGGSAPDFRRIQHVRTHAGIAASVVVTGLQPDDALAVNGLGCEDTIGRSSALPGAFGFAFTR